MDMNEKKKFVAGLSIVSNVALTALKVFAGIISGSLSIISEAIHSMSDLLASFLTFFSVMKSSQPADDDHPYGHGKYEDMSGFIEGALIVLAAIYIIYEASKKIIMGHTIILENNVGIIVMSIAVLMNFIVSTMILKIAKESNSVSLYADGQHLRTDIYSSFGVLLGLIIIKITGYTLIDPIIAILVGVFIYKIGYTISKKTMQNLLDHSLPSQDIEKIKYIVSCFKDEVILKENSIKARQVGPTTDIDLILQFSKDTSICQCHKICDEIEKQIQLIYPNCSISIHPEPVCYNPNCQNLHYSGCENFNENANTAK